MSGLVDIVLTEPDIPGGSLKELLDLQIWIFSQTVGVSQGWSYQFLMGTAIQY